MSEHERYKQLAAMAAIGELSPDEDSVLQRHLNGCTECREIYSEYVRLNAECLVGSESLNGHAYLIAELEETTRAAVMQRISHVVPVAMESAHSAAISSSADAWRPTLRLAWGGAIAIILIVGAFWLGLRYERAISVFPQPQLAISPPAAPPLDSATPISADPSLIEALNQEKQRSSTLEALLQARDDELDRLARANHELERDIADQIRQLNETRPLLASKTNQLNRMEAAHQADTATMVALRYQVQVLTHWVTAQEASLKRQAELLASGREIRDILGARNLHIIGVYDTDGRGRTAKPFARAFYTEGKSLVFYAYDLPLKEKQNGEYAYVAWGQRGGRSSSVRNLGILINDDQTQKRWVMSFSDPNVLAEIDSVFITLEPVRDALRPSGRRMLTAYLDDQPNHP